MFGLGSLGCAGGGLGLPTCMYISSNGQNLAFVWLWVVVAAGETYASASGLMFPGKTPGPATAIVEPSTVRLFNRVLDAEWVVRNTRLWPGHVQNKLTGETLLLNNSDGFSLIHADGTITRLSDLQILDSLQAVRLEPVSGAARWSERLPGWTVKARLSAPNGRYEVDWELILREGANAIRQQITIRAKSEPLQLQAIRLIDLPSVNAHVAGSVPGSPIVVGNFFAGCEHPEAFSVVSNRAQSGLQFDVALAPGQTFTAACSIGIAPPGQMRRAFAYYVERERAHPYRPFLHYNAWYDICWGNRKINETECLEAIDLFGRELIRKRCVPLASFVWDDGWDDPKTLWQPVRANFPRGFTPILERARSYGSALGFWLSPFGGYGQPAQERLAIGKAQGFETGPSGFLLAGTNYYARFLETCTRFVRESGANFFKFDGLARGARETEAMRQLTQTLRGIKPDLFISITTGTWPSPFWLWWGDSTWRGGDDMGFHGQGSKREQWITYRDMETYRRVVRRAPLYPLNSLMTQGFPLAKHGAAAEVGVNPDEVRHDLRSFFASGTCLQELYVTPGRMTDQHWNDLAECASWALARIDVLVDTHWVGGDPGSGEVYGWASWSPKRAVLALRNPTPFPNSITIDLLSAFELPPGARRSYRLISPWREDRARQPLRLVAGVPHRFELQPFEVLVYDATPE